MTLEIHGLGTALPPHQMSQPAALDMTHSLCCVDERQRRLARMLFRKSGVEKRHTAVPHPIAYDWAERETEQTVLHGPSTGERMRLYAEHSPGLAEAASSRALAAAGVEPRAVTHLVTVSCTGFDAPGVDIRLFDSLGLKPTAQRVHVGYMGCHGAINGLRVATGLAAADPRAVILLCACELCSLHYRFSWDDEGIIGNALFADGAGALVLKNKGADGVSQLSTLNSQLPGGEHWSVAATGSCLLPDSREAMSWKVGDHGFEMRLTSDVPRKIEEYLRPG